MSSEAISLDVVLRREDCEPDNKLHPQKAGCLPPPTLREKQLSSRLCPLLTYSNYLFLRWSKPLKQRIITNEFCVPSWKWGHLWSRPCPERALENCKAATFKGSTGKQRKKHLRAEDFPPEKASTSSPSSHHCSHRGACVCMRVCAHMCVQQRDRASPTNTVTLKFLNILANHQWSS